MRAPLSGAIVRRVFLVDLPTVTLRHYSLHRPL